MKTLHRRKSYKETHRHAKDSSQELYQLFDPNLQLEEDGTQVRYLTVREKDDIEPESFRAFIAEAAQIALQRKTLKK